MLIEFYKYQGTGNDFILINNFNRAYTPSKKNIEQWCDRKFGIGSDGLITLSPSEKADFKLVFYNPDGSESFCGNGSRCAVMFALDQGLVKKDKLTFEAFDGLHYAVVFDKNVSISMRDVSEVKIDSDSVFINTGSPHVVVEVNDLNRIDVINEGSKIRYDKKYNPVGTNVNFISRVEGGIAIRTYEKGVEGETLSCGTGVTAAALVFAFKHNCDDFIAVKTRGGDLKVEFKKQNSGFANIKLVGPAEFVYKGIVND